MMKNHSQPTRHWWVVLVVCLAVLVINIDNTILNVALPTLVTSLHATSGQLQWIVDVYSLVFGGLLLVCGSLVDRFGRKIFFLLGLTVFALASTGAGMSSNINTLIGWRAFMGVGGALLIPASLSIITSLFSRPSDRAKAIGIWGAMMGVGVAIGPIIGGLLLSYFSWNAVFYVNVPIAIIGIISGLILIPNSKNQSEIETDILGAFLSIVGIGLLLWAIIEAPQYGWTSLATTISWAVAVIVLALFVWRETSCSSPMLPLRFFRQQQFSVTFLSIIFLIFGLMGALFLQTQILQFYLGYTPIEAGVRILPVAGLLAVVAPFAPLTAHRFGLNKIITIGLACVAAGLWQFTTLSSSSVTYLHVIPGMLLLGLGGGLAIPTITNALIGSVPKRESGIGSAINTMAFQVSGSLGVAVMGSILSTHYKNVLSGSLAARHLTSAIEQIITGSLGGALGVANKVGGPVGSLLSAVARTAFINGILHAFLAGAMVVTAGAIIAFIFMPARLQRDTNREKN